MVAQAQARVGTALSDITIRRVAVGLLIMVVCVPLLTYTEADNSGKFGLEFVHKYAADAAWNATDVVKQSTLQLAVKTMLVKQPNVLLLKTGTKTWV